MIWFKWEILMDEGKIVKKKFIDDLSLWFVIYIVFFLFWWILAFVMGEINTIENFLSLFIMPSILVLPPLLAITIQYFLVKRKINNSSKL